MEAEHAEASGILNRLLDGFRDAMARGDGKTCEIDPTPAMRSLKAGLLEGADPLGVFLHDMTTPDPSGRIAVSAFYATFEKWATNEGRQVWQPRTLRDAMVERGFTAKPIKGYGHWRGLRWTPDAVQVVRDAVGDPPVLAAPVPSDPTADPAAPF